MNFFLSWYSIKVTCKARCIGATLWLLLYQLPSVAQDLFSGIVRGNNNDPLEGATVKVRHAQGVVITGVDGKFSIRALPGDTLEVSFVGYINKRVELSGNAFIEIALAPVVIDLDKVVITGYTSQKIKEIAGSIATVNPKELTAIPAGTIEQMLQGRAAGLNVISSGEPGAPANVRLRGPGNFGDVTPLYIIDGVQGDINSLNPDDIESLQLLKDAAGYSIYGVRGANGVLVVTTKKGRQGKPKVVYDMFVGWQQPLDGLDNLLTPQENAELLWLAKRNSGDTSLNGNPSHYLFGNGAQPVLPDYLFAGPNQDTLKEGSPYVADSLYNLNPDYPPIYQIVRFNKAGTDWFHELYKPAFSQKHSVTISGGSDKNQYLVSLGYLDQEGTYLNTRLQRFTIRVNTEFNYKENLRFGENIQLSYSQNPNANFVSSFDYAGDVSAAVRTSPAQPVYDIRGAWNPGSNYDRVGPLFNPVARRELTREFKDNKWQILGNVYASLSFLKYFNVRSSFGGSQINYFNNFFEPASYDNTTQLNRYTEVSGFISSWTWSNTVNFSRTINDHSVKALAGTEYIYDNSRQMGASSRDLSFTDPNYWVLGNGVPAEPAHYSLARISNLSSFLGRLDYGYKEKYFLSATIRRDGSSVFGPENRFGWFPSLAGAWRISQEPFMQKAEWITDLKIRASWGKTGFYGNTDPSNQFTLYGGSPGTSYYDIFGISSGNIQRGISRVRIGNAKTGWQEDVTTNVGVDLILWNGRLNINADWYIKESKGLLFKLALPDLLGNATPPNVNIGNIQNTGVDITLGSKGSFSRNWHWDVLVTFSHYKNTIIKLNDLNYFDDLLGVVRNEVGFPIGSFYGYKIIGLFQDYNDVGNSPVQPSAAPGRFKYADINGRDASGKLTGIPDGMISDADRMHYGSPHPDFTLGFNFSISFKRFDLTTFFYGSFGNDVLNMVKLDMDVLPPDVILRGIGPASKTALYDSWTPERKNAKAPIAETSYNFSNRAEWNSYPLEKGSYLRNKSLVLGYSFSDNALNKMKLERLRVYVQVINLFTITKYSGLDPELSRSGFNVLPSQSTNSVFGIDYANYPNNQKQFLFGLTLGL